MSWFSILKIDNIINDPNNPGQAWFNPEDNTVNMNIGNPSWKEIDDEDKLIAALEEMITHEYSHKAMSSETYPIQQQNMKDMESNFLGYVLKGDDSAIERFTTAAFNFAETLAAEETYAYLTSAIGEGNKRRKNLPRITISTFIVGDSIMEQLMSIVNRYGREILTDARKQKGVEFSNELAQFLTKRIKKLLTIFANQTAKKVQELNMAYMDFVKRANNMTELETKQGKQLLLGQILEFMIARIPE